MTALVVATLAAVPLFLLGVYLSVGIHIEYGGTLGGLGASPEGPTRPGATHDVLIVWGLIFIALSVICFFTYRRRA